MEKFLKVFKNINCFSKKALFFNCWKNLLNYQISQNFIFLSQKLIFVEEGFVKKLKHFFHEVFISPVYFQ